MGFPNTFFCEAADNASPFPGVSRVINPKGGALAQLYPFDCSISGSASSGFFGQYRAQVATSALAYNGSNVNILGFRFAPTGTTNTPAVCVIQRVLLHLYTVTGVTAQRMDPFLMFPARAYTASETTNISNVVTLTGNTLKMRTSFAATGVAQICGTSNVAGISGGTKTVDTTPIGQFAASGPGLTVANLGVGVTAPIFEADQTKGEYPFVLVANEGFVIQGPTTAIGSGTVITAMEVHWAELGQF